MDRSRRRLILLNAGLLAALSVLTVASVAGQPGVGSDRPRGDYGMVAGKIQGSTAHAIYILDATNQELVALGWDRSNNKLVGIGFRSLSTDGRAQNIGR